MKHEVNIEIVRADGGHWLAICYECGWHGDYWGLRGNAEEDAHAHAREARR